MRLELTATPSSIPAEDSPTAPARRLRAVPVRPADPASAPTVPIAPEVTVPRPFIRRLLLAAGLLSGR